MGINANIHNLLFGKFVLFKFTQKSLYLAGGHAEQVRECPENSNGVFPGDLVIQLKEHHHLLHFGLKILGYEIGHLLKKRVGILIMNIVSTHDLEIIVQLVFCLIQDVGEAKHQLSYTLFAVALLFTK